MNPMEAILSLIIVNWNTREILLKCLSAVYEHPFSVDLEVWVVDNASADDSAAAVRQRYPQVKLIECSENIGFARGNNLALERARGEYVLLLNTDALVGPGAIAQLFEFLKTHPAAAAAGPYLLNPDQTLQESCYPFPSLSREFWRMFHLDNLFPYGRYDMSRWDPTQPRSVDCIQGACLMLRREALNQVGLFDPHFFMYTEEIDLCYRLKKAGWDLYWVPAARVIHYGGQSTRQVAPQMFLSLYETKVYFFRKHYGVLAARMYKLLLTCASLVRIALSPLAWLQAPPDRARNLTLARRYLDLLGCLPKM